ncbi:MAG: glutamate--tRNA ligase [Candidatus Gracilibacteria bacterium]|nr:glutamate--tRNA ligase [Candidatus Gracilibacteria bacterium]MDQ7023449.1 glutamate--tRNA ligase [Candidatus Gracilibacteria bacterium]
MTIKTRFAPSPTGYLHIGSLRTVLYNYLYAKQKGGSFMLRVEDTDRTRLVEDSIENMLEILEKFGMTPDEGPNSDLGNGPYVQSERLDIYQKYIKELIEKEQAYYCFCTPERLTNLREEQQSLKIPTKYDQNCRFLTEEETQAKLDAGEKYTVRLKVPKDINIEFIDAIKGKISVPSKDVDDQVLLKTDGFPTYHFAVVVDDYLMKVTDIIRGDEWIPSTPKHVLIYRAFGWEIPRISHIPPLIGANKKKLSKRDGDVAVEQYLEKGYLIEAIINYLALLGWNPKTTEEFFTMSELIERFDLEAVHKSGAFFDVERLDFFNAHYLKNMDILELYEKFKKYLSIYDKEFLEKISNFSPEYNKKILSELNTRIKKFDDLKGLTIYFYGDYTFPEDELILNSKMKLENFDDVEKALNITLEILKNKSGKFESTDEMKAIFIEKIKEAEMKNGQVLWPTRCALSGEKFSPGAFEMIYILGKEESINRIEKYLNSIK